MKKLLFAALLAAVLLFGCTQPNQIPSCPAGQVAQLMIATCYSPTGNCPPPQYFCVSCVSGSSCEGTFSTGVHYVGAWGLENGVCKCHPYV